MIENRPVVTFISHCTLLGGIAIIAFPIWITFVASTHDAVRMTQIPLPLLPGDQFFANLNQALNLGIEGGANKGVGMMLFSRQDCYLVTVGICHRLFPLPVSHGFLLDDFHHPDAAGGSQDHSHLRGGG
jgi:ABC-type glycerol-3-phosphate transport system permease component